MSLIIDLPASAEKALKSKARAEGLSAERYAQQVLERDLTPAERAGAIEAVF